jgi:hypothetical protein
MEEHKFRDDVAICKAISKQRAIKKFSKLYECVSKEEVRVVVFNRKLPSILTDY